MDHDEAATTVPYEHGYRLQPKQPVVKMFPKPGAAPATVVTAAGVTTVVRGTAPRKRKSTASDAGKGSRLGRLEREKPRH